nr:SH3 domain-containing protein [Anaerolineae bacterium]
GLWMGFASQANDGSVYALGAPGDRNGPREALRIYNMSGQAITGTIGDGFPDRVEWSPDGRAVFVQTNGRQYIANINGQIQDISGQVAGARAINWVNGDLPQGNDGGNVPTGGGIAPVGQPDTGTGSQPAGQLPSGVVEGSEYQPGTQLRVYVQELNVRTAPGVNSPIARGLPLITGDYVVILAGPVDADGARWWQVQTADNVIGWIAGAINGSPTLGQ